MSTYLITGCSRGLGLEFVKQLAKSDDARFILATARSQEAPDALRSIIDGSQGRVSYLQLDADDNQSIASAVDKARSILEKAGLDILINNAGIGIPGLVEDLTGEDLQAVLKTNVVSVHEVSRAFLPQLKLGKGKKIINITSNAGSFAMQEMFSWLPAMGYKVSKAALNLMTVEYARVLKKDGFTVLCVAPGHLKTDLGTVHAELEVDVGARATLDIIRESGPKDSGRFRLIHIDDHPYYNGVDVPW